MFSFGARSFSVRAAGSTKLLYDSFDEIEAHIQELNPGIFNAEIIPDMVVKDTADLRSDILV